MKKTIKATQLHTRSTAPASAALPQGANGGARQQKGLYEVFKPHVSDDVLRKMDHSDWLEQFAKVMQMQTGVEMTPMRAGVINRCEMAAQYIKLLEGESRALTTRLAEATRELQRLKSRGDQEGAAGQRADPDPGKEGDGGG